MYAVLYVYVYHASFFYKNCIYFVHVNDCRLIESKHEAAKYVYSVAHQLSTIYWATINQAECSKNDL